MDGPVRSTPYTTEYGVYTEYCVVYSVVILRMHHIQWIALGFAHYGELSPSRASIPSNGNLSGNYVGHTQGAGTLTKNIRSGCTHYVQGLGDPARQF